MEVVESTDQIGKLKDNIITGDIKLVQSSVIFKGKGNILFTSSGPDNEANVTLKNTVISFNQNNSVVYLNNSSDYYQINLSLFNNCFCYIGADNYFSGVLTMQCSEQSNIIIGDKCMFSAGIWFRTSDVHLIYDIESRKRVNDSASIFIGDHVWIGQDAKLWKGTHIGSGAILGADSFTSGKRIPSNTVWGGNPAKLIRKGAFFVNRVSTHSFTNVETKACYECYSNEGVFQFDENETVNFTELEHMAKSYSTAEERAAFLYEFSENEWKNRFFIG